MSQYIEFLQEWLAPLGEITARAMFGGHCLYCDGVVFALVASQEVFLKVDSETRPAYEAIGSRPFLPFPDKPEVMQYYPPPPEFFDNSDVMLQWGRAAVEVARRAKAKRPARRKQAARGRASAAR
ncbi:MAG TPA: TfoX/Sxy family protein [Paludibaculum sp.]|jgi:DNA transformation protein